jgi:hypothetical protein
MGERSSRESWFQVTFAAVSNRLEGQLFGQRTDFALVADNGDSDL